MYTAEITKKEAVNRDIVLEELIRDKIDEYLNVYDDACRQITKNEGSEKKYYIDLAKESMTMVKDLLTQLPDVDREIRVYTEKAQ